MFFGRRLFATATIVPSGAGMGSRIAYTVETKNSIPSPATVETQSSDHSSHESESKTACPLQRLQSCVFIGAGRMAEAMIKGLLKAEMCPSKLTVLDINKPRLSLFQDKGLNTVHAVDADKKKEVLQKAEVVVLAVKPQQAEEVIKEISTMDPNPEALFLSVCAGVTLKTLKLSSIPATVRAMPNTPALVGCGFTVWYTSKEVTPDHLVITEGFLKTLGSDLRAFEEQYLDMATALSGTGPAYFFLVMEAMIEAGVHMGFQRDVARDIVLQTAKGAALLAEETGRQPSELRSDITSPAGTTAEAVYFAERGAFRTVISDAVWSAYRRSLELGGTVDTRSIGPVPR